MLVVRTRASISVDQRDKISSGGKSDKGFPVALDHFNITSFPELVAVYGQKPTYMLIYFPSDAIETFFEDQMVLYAGKPGKEAVKVRTCNGMECIHRISETLPGADGKPRSYEKGELSECVCQHLAEDHPKRCKYRMYLKALVADPKTGKIISPRCYLFDTGSMNSGNSVKAELDKMASLTTLRYGRPKLALLPFVISVKMASGKTDASKKFPIWNLSVWGTMAQIAARLEKLARGNVAPLVEEHKDVLELPAPVQNPAEESLPEEPSTELPFDGDPRT